jgi:hypothetical protein
MGRRRVTKEHAQMIDVQKVQVPASAAKSALLRVTFDVEGNAFDVAVSNADAVCETCGVTVQLTTDSGVRAAPFTVRGAIKIDVDKGYAVSVDIALGDVLQAIMQGMQ